MRNATIALEIGTEIFNHGDMANAAHFGTVSRVKADNYGVQVQIQPLEAEIPAYWVNDYTFSQEYKGNGMTRLVLRSAYTAWAKSARS